MRKFQELTGYYLCLHPKFQLSPACWLTQLKRQCQIQSSKWSNANRRFCHSAVPFSTLFCSADRHTGQMTGAYFDPGIRGGGLPPVLPQLWAKYRLIMKVCLTIKWKVHTFWHFLQGYPFNPCSVTPHSSGFTIYKMQTHRSQVSLNKQFFKLW